MNNPSTAIQTQNQTVSAAKRIDEIAKGAMEYFDQAGSMEAELAVASAIGDLRAALTPEVMRPIMALMNTNLGFKTDRDPARSKNAVTPYSIETVRDVVIEAKLRGAHLVGNEVNIIAGGCYLTKNFCMRKVRSWPGVTDVADVYEVPRTQTGGAIVKCHATWKRDGVADRIDREFPIKVNEFMGADAILGKCQRKLFAAILAKLSGNQAPEGEVDDDTPAPRITDAEMKKPSFGAVSAPTAASAPELAIELPTEKKVLVDWMTRKAITWPALQAVLRQPLYAKNFSFADSVATVEELSVAQAKLIHTNRTVFEELIEVDAGGQA